jgi:hypothetical protein
MTQEEKNQMNALQEKHYKRRGLHFDEFKMLIELRREFVLSQGFNPDHFNLDGANITFGLSGDELIDMRVNKIIPERFKGFSYYSY